MMEPLLEGLEKTSYREGDTRVNCLLYTSDAADE